MYLVLSVTTQMLQAALLLLRQVWQVASARGRPR